MKLKFNLKNKILSNLPNGSPTSSSGQTAEPHYVESLSTSNDANVAAALQVSPSRQGWTLGCFPMRRKRNQAPVLLEPPTYEQALQLDDKNPTRVVRDRVMRSLPKAKPKGKEAEEGCRICLSPFERATEIPCKHIFCRECIKKWLSCQRTCPICRYEFCDKQTKLVIPK